MAKVYLEKGHIVGICGRDLSKTETTISSFTNLKKYELDINDHEKLRSALENFCEKEPLDIMIANAGVGLGNKTRKVDLSRSYGLLNTNIMGVVASFDLALNHIRKNPKGGQLVVYC